MVFTNHTRYDLYAQHYLPYVPSALSENFVTTFLPTFTGQVDAVIAPSASVGEMIRKWGVKTRIEVIPNGVDVQAIRQPSVRLTRAEVGIPDTAMVGVFVGRMASEKSVDRLIHAFAGVARVLPEAYLLLVGSGPYVEDYKILARELRVADRVLFTGRVPYEHIPAYLHLSDLFVTASTTEVHPLTVLEAMAAGLPVVGIRSPGLSDTVVDGVNGYLTDNDYAALAAALTMLIVDKSLLTHLAEGAGQTADAYDIRLTTDHILSLYRQVLDKSRDHTGKKVEG